MKRHLRYYLNDYAPQHRKLRIERLRGGFRTIWSAVTTHEKMEQTKSLLEKAWKR